uniref:Complex1_LYR_dom domain-containing protein n=1 Tax=Schistosoma mansoni TaxID=6183 RepID=A0A5K4F7D2_SCHMA
MTSRREILTLYKNLLTYVNNLKHSDKSYLKKRIQSTFKENKVSTDDDETTRLYKKGCEILRLKRFI